MGYGLQVEMYYQQKDSPELLQWSSKGMLDALAMGYEVFGFGSILDKVAQKLAGKVYPREILQQVYKILNRPH